jgi:hypothetical protein
MKNKKAVSKWVIQLILAIMIAAAAIISISFIIGNYR